MEEPSDESRIRALIDKHDYEAVFTAGCCFHFALRLYERFGYKIRGTRYCQKGRLSHVWCQKSGTGQAIDIHGVHDEDLLVALGHRSDEIRDDVLVYELLTVINEKHFSPALEKQIFNLADWLIDTHERLKAAKPTDPAVIAAGLANLAQSSGL